KPELVQEGREEEVTLLFCDIRGFSRISDNLGPAKTVRWISAALEMLSECVLHHNGVVVDYQGDQVAAMWGAPEKQQDHAERACLAALEMLARLPELNQVWEPVIGAQTEVGIGINSGPARVGN